MKKIYFIGYYRNKKLSYVKIGHSVNPHNRLKDSKTFNPDKSKVLFYFPETDVLKEHKYHNVFETYLIPGSTELFHYRGELKKWIRNQIKQGANA